MRARIVAAALGSALGLTLLTAPAARADLSSHAAITGGAIRSGGDVVLGPRERRTFEVSFTATDDSGIRPYGAEATLLGPGGGVLYGDPGSGPPCTPVNATTSMCRFTITVDTGSTRIENDNAGVWRLVALATPNDWNPATGEGVVSSGTLATVRIKRRSQLTVDAFPEPVRVGRTLSFLGRLTFADWNGDGYTGSAGHPVRLVFLPATGSRYNYVQDLETSVYGLAVTTAAPDGDGWWWYAYPGTQSTSWAYSAADYVDVQ